jgi:cytochrome c553/cytochrome c551/c552/mono/diheme cytochrome c family protein
MSSLRMRTFRRAASVFLLLLMMLPARSMAIQGDFQPDLFAGLVTVYTDKASPPVEITRLEPTVALALHADEAPHPRLRSDGGTVVWKGYINVIRSGNYHFQANLRGKFRMTVGGKEVLAGDVQDAKPQLKEGADLRLDAGVVPLVAEYTRPAGAARVEVFWQGPGFRLEPLPFDVLGHLPAQATPQLEHDARLEQGRFLAEKYACVRCHRPAAADRMAAGLTSTQGPDLSQIGARDNAGWIARWLASPHALRPGAIMPVMFADDDAGKAERYAAAHYLASLGGAVKDRDRPLNEKDRTDSVHRGQALYNSLGCTACHSAADAKATKISQTSFIVSEVSHFPLTGLGSKTTPERLAIYLQDPLAHDPGGRMPRMLLQQNEALDLSNFLCQSKVEGLAPTLPEAPLAPKSEDWNAVGKRLVVAKGCANCHTVLPGGRPILDGPLFTALDDLKKAKSPDKGCLADDAAQRGKAPDFGFAAADRDALRLFLVEGLNGAGSPAPAHAARETIRRFNCLACHNRDGEGGLSIEIVEQLRKFQNAESAEAVLPPVLTGVGHKLRTPWMRQVLLNAGRARPWMSLRMPQFGDANVGALPEQIAALEGTLPDEEVHKTVLTAMKIEAGRTLIGKSTFGCISCHDLAGVPNTGTRGPDLAGMNQRVRYEWYLRWLEQPQRMQPGTRMPQVFTDGKSLLASVLNGDAAAQADAMWGYLSLGPGLPLPEGMGAPKGLVLAVKDKPYLLRTFMPDAGSRAVAVGFPGGVSAAFDAHTCRLAYAWSGAFLDATPVWDGRGGNPAHVLGPHIWNAPAGCPIAATTSNEPPDFAARAKDPAFGGALPEGKVFDGAPLLHFDGYGEDKTGAPTFRYHLQAGTDDRLDVSERLEALRTGAAAGVARQFSLNVPARQVTWLLAGESAAEPRLLDAQGAPLALDLKSGTAETPAAGKALLLSQDGDHAVVLRMPTAPEGAVWRVQKGGAGWIALVRLSSAADASKPRIDLQIWAPYRNEPELIKELFTAR